MGILDRFKLDGRVALVPAGSGPQFGSRLSEGLAEAGATVISASRSLERNEQFAAGLREQGHDVHAAQVDITDVDSINALRDQVLGEHGQLDVLVNSALARDGHAGAFDEQTPEVISRSAAGDFTGLFAICQAFLPTMIEQGRGSIINISSIYGVVGNDPTIYLDTDMKQPATYAFVKAGMINFTRYLANYYGKLGIRANCISPGGYFNNQPESFVEEYTRRVPIGRMLDNEDIKGSVVYLASDASGYVNGHNLLVDGGWTAV